MMPIQTQNYTVDDGYSNMIIEANEPLKQVSVYIIALKQMKPPYLQQCCEHF